jgi:hypothetical protein
VLQFHVIFQDSLLQQLNWHCSVRAFHLLGCRGGESPVAAFEVVAGVSFCLFLLLPPFCYRNSAIEHSCVASLAAIVGCLVSHEYTFVT